jgi:hypothetical protein
MSVLLAATGFIAIYLIPNLKYPANPPSVGNPETIGIRTALYFIMIAFSVAAMVAAIALKRLICAAIWQMEHDLGRCGQLPHIGGGRRPPIADNQRGSRRVPRGCAVEIPNWFDWCTTDHVGHSRCAIWKLDRTGFFSVRLGA